MSTQSSSDSNAPLLRSRQGDSDSPPSPARPATLATLLGRASGRRGPSMLVRETAARHLEERRADWGYSKPVVALDMMWNTAFVVVSAVMLLCTLDERPNTPIRVWICGYALQCAVHVVLVWLEYRSRNTRRASTTDDENQVEAGGEANDSEDEEHGIDRVSASFSRSSFTKRCESVNTMASFLWWIVGFYWVVSGGDELMQNAPRLYWLAVVFLAFDVFFAIFCVVLACLIGIALCCCLPCIIAILYAVAGQEGASEADLSILPKYRFQVLSNEEKPSGGAGSMVPVETNSGYLANEQLLLPEDAMSSAASENDEMIDLDPFDSESIQNEEVKTKRRKRSNVWAFFEMVPDSENNDGKPRAKCKMCGVIYMAASKYGTGNMRRHIETCPRRSSRDIGQMMLSQNSGNISEFDTFRPDELSGYMKKSQLDLYLDEPRAERNAKIDILSFWKGNEFRYPDLARMARDILSVPVSTVASESTFSVGGRIIDQFRSALKADIVEALVCTRDWLYGEEQEIQEEVKLDELTEDVMELENNKGKGLEDAPPHSSSSRFV